MWATDAPPVQIAMNDQNVDGKTLSGLPAVQTSIHGEVTDGTIYYSMPGTSRLYFRLPCPRQVCQLLYPPTGKTGSTRLRSLSITRFFERDQTAAKRHTAVVKLLHWTAWTYLYLGGCRGRRCLTGCGRPGSTRLLFGDPGAPREELLCCSKIKLPRRSTIASRSHIAQDQSKKIDRPTFMHS